MKIARPLIIVGAGGMGLDACFLAERMGKTIRGFLDDHPPSAASHIMGLPVLGRVANWRIFPECEFIVAIGDPRVRQQVVTAMRTLGTPEFATLIDPTAVFDPHHVKLGKGSIICAGVVLTTQITIGEHVIININCTVAHEVQMGNFVTLAPMAAMSGKVKLGDLVEVGTGSCIRQSLTMATGSMLGMGAVLIKSTEKNAVLVGNPARVLRYLQNSIGE